MSKEAFERVLAIEKLGWDKNKSTMQPIFDFKKKQENQDYLDKWIAQLIKEERAKLIHIFRCRCEYCKNYEEKLRIINQKGGDVK